jgi:hypothetical protein
MFESPSLIWMRTIGFGIRMETRARSSEKSASAGHFFKIKAALDAIDLTRCQFDIFFARMKRVTCAQPLHRKARQRGTQTWNALVHQARNRNGSVIWRYEFAITSGMTER